MNYRIELYSGMDSASSPRGGRGVRSWRCMRIYESRTIYADILASSSEEAKALALKWVEAYGTSGKRFKKSLRAEEVLPTKRNQGERIVIRERQGHKDCSAFEEGQGNGPVSNSGVKEKAVCKFSSTHNRRQKGSSLLQCYRQIAFHKRGKTNA